MKLSLLIMFLVLSIWSAKAQDATYRPFIEEGKVWVSGMYTEIYEDWHLQHYIVYDYFLGDTIVNGLKCKCWRQRYVPQDEKERPEYVFTLAAYEENKKVWFFQEGDSVPRLAYDFGANPGDTIVVYLADARLFRSQSAIMGPDFYDTNDKDSLVILSHKEIVVGEQIQKVMYYTSLSQYKTYENPRDYIIEGVGSVRGPFDNLGYRDGTSPIYLAYCQVNNDIIFYNEYWANYWDIPLPTSITAPRSDASSENRSSSSANWTDLSGRHLSSPPSRPGLYIRDGRKVLVK